MKDKFPTESHLFYVQQEAEMVSLQTHFRVCLPYPHRSQLKPTAITSTAMNNISSLTAKQKTISAKKQNGDKGDEKTTNTMLQLGHLLLH